MVMQGLLRRPDWRIFEFAMTVYHRKMSDTLLVSVTAVVFLGALTRMTFGFGEAVITMPLLTLLPLPWRTTVALMGLVGLTVACVAIIAGRRHIDWRILWPLALSALVGIPMGLLMMRVVPEPLMIGILGALLIAYGIASLARKRDYPVHWASRWSLLFGFVSGALGSAYNLNGIPIAVYGTLSDWPPDTFRSTLQGYFLVSGALIVSAQGLSGLWSRQMFTLYGLSLPAIAAAILVGRQLHRHLSTAKFQRALYILIAGLGALLITRALG